MGARVVLNYCFSGVCNSSIFTKEADWFCFEFLVLVLKGTELCLGSHMLVGFHLEITLVFHPNYLPCVCFSGWPLFGIHCRAVLKLFPVKYLQNYQTIYPNPHLIWHWAYNGTISLLYMELLQWMLSNGLNYDFIKKSINITITYITCFSTISSAIQVLLETHLQAPVWEAVLWSIILSMLMTLLVFLKLVFQSFTLYYDNVPIDYHKHENWLLQITRMVQYYLFQNMA